MLPNATSWNQFWYFEHTLSSTSAKLFFECSNPKISTSVGLDMAVRVLKSKPKFPTIWEAGNLWFCFGFYETPRQLAVFLQFGWGCFFCWLSAIKSITIFWLAANWSCRFILFWYNASTFFCQWLGEDREGCFSIVWYNTLQITGHF